MADEEIDAAARERVLSHMNADHQVSLVAYLRVYCKVTENPSYTAKLEDINLLSMVISYGGSRYSVPFEPPMNSIRDARTRLVDMHSRCLDQLGESDIIIREYTIPRGFHAVVFALCFSAYICLSRRSNFLPGSILYSAVFQYFPKFANLCYVVQPTLLATMVLIHVVEAGILAVKVLKPHRVPMFSGLWWKWMISVFIEGYGAFQRTEKIVQKERKRIDEAKASK